MASPKLFIATPAHDHRFAASYVYSLIKLSGAGFYPLRFSKVGGAGIARARNNQVAEFLSTDCTHFFCIDSDIVFEPAHVRRVVEADRDIVCGLYALKQHELAWCVNGIAGSEIEPATGLQRVAKAGTGFKCIKRSVLERFIAAHPETAYIEDIPGEKGHVRHDIFRMGVVGPSSADSLLGAIRSLYASYESGAFDHESSLACGLMEILRRPTVPGRYLTEDWYFDHIAEQLGIPIWVDTTFHLGHEGIITFPLQDPFATDAHSLAAGLVVAWPPAALAAGVPVGHAADVLAGAYDVPVEFAVPPVVLDIGANLGAFALWSAARWPGAQIHCYEPHPANFRLLEVATADVGGIVRGNFGLGRPEWSALHEGKNNCGECSFFDLGEQTARTVPVSVQPAQVTPEADLIKIDTEGAELEILTQLAAAGRLARPRAVMLEYHRDSDRPLLRQLLENHGFTLHAEKVRCRDRGEFKFIRP